MESAPWRVAAKNIVAAIVVANPFITTPTHWQHKHCLTAAVIRYSNTWKEVKLLPVVVWGTLTTTMSIRRSKLAEDFVFAGKSPDRMFREDQFAVDSHVENTIPALD